MDGKDYAVVSVGRDAPWHVSTTTGVNELPVNFKAERNGTYTLIFSSENVAFRYLHLIDNMTGADVDMLQTPQYTFEARTTDYAYRFKLVFSICEDANGDNAFAFINNGNIVITDIVGDAGTASLQVIDVMGRVIVSRKGDAINRVSTRGMTAGVYVLRLIYENDIRTQKIVIK